MVSLTEPEFAQQWNQQTTKDFQNYNSDDVLISLEISDLQRPMERLTYVQRSSSSSIPSKAPTIPSKGPTVPSKAPSIPPKAPSIPSKASSSIATISSISIAIGHTGELESIAGEISIGVANR